MLNSTAITNTDFTLREIQNIEQEGESSRKGRQQWKGQTCMDRTVVYGGGRAGDVKKMSYAGLEYLLELSQNNDKENCTSREQTSRQPTSSILISQLQQKIAALTTQKQSLARRNTSYLKQNQELTVKIIQLKEEYRVKEVEGKSVALLVEKIEGLKEDTLGRGKGCGSDIGKLKEHAKKLQIKCKQLMQQNQRICSTHETTTNALKSQLQTLTKTSTSQSTLFSQQLKAKQDQLKIARHVYQKELKELRKTNQSQARRIEELERSVTERESGIQRNFRVLEEMRDISDRQTKQNRSEVEVIRAQIAQVQKQHETKITQLQHTHNQTVHSLHQSLHSQSTLTTQLQQCLAQKSLQCNKALAQREEYKSQVIKLKEINCKLNGRLEESVGRCLGALGELEGVRARVGELEGCVARLERDKREGELQGRLMIERTQEAALKLQAIDRTYLQQKHQLQQNIKFLTEQLTIWSQKYQTLSTQHTSLSSQLQSYKQMYSILEKKQSESQKIFQHSQITHKSSQPQTQSQKDTRSLLRQLEGLRTEIGIMREEKEKIEGMLNQELGRRKEMIQELIREKKIMYGVRGQGRGE